MKQPQIRDEFLLKVARKDAKGGGGYCRIKICNDQVPKIKLDELEFTDNPSQEQLLIRNAWLKPNH